MNRVRRSQKIRDSLVLFFPTLQKVQEQEIEAGQISNVSCVNSSCQGQLEHVPYTSLLGEKRIGFAMKTSFTFHQHSVLKIIHTKNTLALVPQIYPEKNPQLVSFKNSQHSVQTLQTLERRLFTDLYMDGIKTLFPVLTIIRLP